MHHHGKQAMLILGMHRSGTSATAGAVRMLGADPPANMLPATPDNPLGFYESPGVMAVNDWILQAAGMTWYDCLDRFALPDVGADRMASALIRICLDSEYPNAALALIKDPRLCLLLDVWLPTLTVLRVDPLALLVLRRPGEVAASLARRNACPMPIAQALWLHHMLSAERATRGLPRTVICYEALLLDWRGTLERAGRRLGIAWPIAPDAAEESVRKFLRLDLRHHRIAAANAEPSQSPGAFGDWLDAAYQALLGLSEADGEGGPPLTQLDDVRSAFNDWRLSHGKVLTASLLDGHPLRARPPPGLPSGWERLAADLIQGAGGPAT